MKRSLLFACIFLATALLSACHSDSRHYGLYDTIVGRVWAGDLGFYDGRYPLDSYIYFAGDGFGDDELYYADNGQFFGRFNIQWQIAYDTLYISYGNIAVPRELRRISFGRRTVSGELYVGGLYYGYITLYLQ